MRFLLFDRVLELEKGTFIRATKGVTLSEDVHSESQCGVCYMPEPLIVEALAQIAGWLINVSKDFQRSSLMTMVTNAEFHRRVRAGDRLTMKAEIVRLEDEVAVARAEAVTDEGPVATIEEILFVLVTLPEAQIPAEKRKFAYFSGDYPVGN